MKNDTDIDALIGKYLAGEAGPEEAMELEDWKNRSDANRLYFEQCARLFGVNSGKEFTHANTHAAWKKMNLRPDEKEIRVVPMRQRIFWRVAAAVAVLLVMTTLIVFLVQENKTGNIVYASGNAIKKVELTDHSQIEIMPRSSLELSQGFGVSNRTVKLKGSGKFSVQHDEKLPFIIDAGKVYIKDLGTVFTVTDSAGMLSVSVSEGSVMLYDSLGTMVTIRAPYSATYTRGSRRVSTTDIIDQFSSPVSLYFDNALLGEVVEKLKAQYNVSIELQNPALAQCTITTSFVDQDIKTIMTILSETLGLEYEQTATGYLLKGESCNH